MSMRFLNVDYQNYAARIDTDTMVDICQVQEKIEFCCKETCHVWRCFVQSLIEKQENLPDLAHFLTKKELMYLKLLNNTIHPALHSELIVGEDGKMEIILPFDLTYLKPSLQAIAEKTKLVKVATDLVVNHDSLSGSSSDSIYALGSTALV